MPFTNSYILKSNLGPLFKEELQKAVGQVIKGNKFDTWWGPNPHELHLTIASGDGIKEGKKTTESTFSIQKRNEIFKQKMSDIFGVFSKSILMIPHNIRISQYGFIILEFMPAPMDTEEMKTLQELHNRFVDLGKKSNMKFNLEFCYDNFRPHVSIGKVKTRIPGRKYPTLEEVSAAAEIINKNKTKILAQLDIDKVRILNIYNLELGYSVPLDKEFALLRSNLGDYSVLAKKELPPRDYNVLSVTPSKDKSEMILQFSDPAKTKKCEEFLFQLGIFCKKNRGDISSQNPNCITLTQQEYSRVAGMIKNCYPPKTAKVPALIFSIAKPSASVPAIANVTPSLSVGNGNENRKGNGNGNGGEQKLTIEKTKVSNNGQNSLSKHNETYNKQYNEKNKEQNNEEYIDEYNEEYDPLEEIRLQELWQEADAYEYFSRQLDSCPF